MIENFFRMIMKKDKEGWQTVKYPPPLSKKVFGFIPIRIILLISIICLEAIITANISDKIHSNIGQIIITMIFIYIIYKTIIYYKKFKAMKQEGNKII